MKIGIVGAESSGKTTLANALGAALQVPVVAEQARAYLADRPTYTEADLTLIARQQQQALATAEAEAPPYLIADTTLLTIQLWAMYRFGRCDEAIAKGCAEEQYDRYFLCDYGIDWTYDPLREHASIAHRAAIHALYAAYLWRKGAKVVVIQGTPQERTHRALADLTGGRL